MKKHFGHRFRVLHWCTDLAMTNALAEMDLTSAQGHIMGFLSRQTQPPCSRDLEAHLRLSHPTVSGLLSRLESKGFIELRPDPADRRCKRIYILPKGQQCNERIHQEIDHNEQRITQGFTPGEQQQFLAFLDRAIQNMGTVPCKKQEEDS